MGQTELPMRPWRLADDARETRPVRHLRPDSDVGTHVRPHGRARVRPERAAGRPRTLQPSTLLDLQRQVGNRAVGTLVRALPRAVPLAEVDAAAETTPDDVTPMYAGTTAAQPPPGGLAAIVARGSGAFNPGYTGIKSAAAFGSPSVATRPIVRREQPEGYSYPIPRHYAVFEPTSATDATHESLYPAPGLHPVRRLGRTYRVMPDVSDRIREGEQEHLDDAQRAFDLTYGRVAEVVNDLASRGQEFGPASSPHAATELALRHLATALGPLTSSPTRWRELLDELLGLSKTVRDGRGWHVFTTDLVHLGQRRVHDVVEGPNANIGVPSTQVVNLPGTGGAGPSGGGQSGPAAERRGGGPASLTAAGEGLGSSGGRGIHHRRLAPIEW